MANTHLCGSIYDSKAAGRCPFLLFADKPGMKHGYYNQMRVYTSNPDGLSPAVYRRMQMEKAAA